MNLATVTAGAQDEGALTLSRETATGPAAQSTLISPKQEGARFGESVATRDFDQDGHDDILAVATGTGRAYAVDGANRTLSVPAVLAEEPVQDTDVATGDFDHDGYADAAITCMVFTLSLRWRLRRTVQVVMREDVLAAIRRGITPNIVLQSPGDVNARGPETDVTYKINERAPPSFSQVSGPRQGRS